MRFQSLFSYFSPLGSLSQALPCTPISYARSPMTIGICSFNSGSLETFRLGRSNCLSLSCAFLCPATHDQEPAGKSRGQLGQK